MSDGDLTFHSEVNRILEEFELRRLEDSDERLDRKDEWRRSVHDFRELARQVIVPTLRELKNPLRARGLRPYISNNTRQGLNIWLEVDAEQLRPISLVFRLDAERRSIEVEGLTDAEPTARLVTRLETCDRQFVEAAVVSFLRRLP